ncbi:MAG: hypothetical protein JWM16_345 [Verrucomicrobiales bacterium]|nr:hypothetical protein [Verrucomicrobiales bacterium]
MSFLNPIMLFGLAAVSVPIIIHLLNRRRFQKVVWAAMKFLKISVEQNQRRMRIEDMILLALRCLLLALLALALARPAILSNKADVFGQSKVTGVVILDNSYSMGVTDGTLTRFDKARKAAEQVLDSMPIGSATAVFLASDIAQGVIPEPTFDMNLARKTLREAPLSDRGTDLYPAIEKAVDTLKDRLVVRKEIYLITDGQANGWKELPGVQKILERYKSQVKVHVIMVGEHEEHNLGVSDLRLASGLSPVNQPLRFEVRVSNFGKEESRDIRVGITVDNEPAGDEFTIASLPAGASRSISLFTKLRTEGFHAVTARIPEDRLHADDQRTIVVRAIKEVKVLLVDGEPSDEPRAGETYYLRNALIPVSPDMAPDYFIKAATITAPELTQARLDDYDAVILANVADCSEATLKSFEQYLRRGGGLMIFPGNKVNVTFYNEQLFNHYKFLPASLGTSRGDADQEDKFFTLQEKDYQHPVVAIWNDPASGTLGSAHFFRAFTLQPPPISKQTNEKKKAEEAGEPEIILKYADGTPAMAERTWGLGKVVLFSSTADTAWNDLPVRLAFVPLMHRALGSIVARQDEGLNIKVGEVFIRRASTEALDKDVTFFKPRQAGTLHDLRHVDMQNGWPTISYDRTDFAGVYEANVTEPALAIKFAAQPDASESSLDELSASQLATLKTVANVTPWSSNLSLRGMVEKDRTGLEFWLPIAVVALLIALLETFLGQWFSRSK